MKKIRRKIIRRERRSMRGRRGTLLRPKKKTNMRGRGGGKRTRWIEGDNGRCKTDQGERGVVMKDDVE